MSFFNLPLHKRLETNTDSHIYCWSRLENPSRPRHFGIQGCNSNRHKPRQLDNHHQFDKQVCKVLCHRFRWRSSFHLRSKSGSKLQIHRNILPHNPYFRHRSWAHGHIQRVELGLELYLQGRSTGVLMQLLQSVVSE